MTSDEYKSLKVPTWVYNNAQQLRADLVRGGIEQLPEKLRAPTRCPCCSGSVDHVSASVKVSYDYVRCRNPQCNYKQQVFTAKGHLVASIGLGVLLGLGITAIVAASTNKTPKRRKAKAKALRR